VDPANAILNYAYGVLEGQCRQALTAEGFDLSCGFLHADKQFRDSLVYDLMELYRPAVDALVLAFLDRTTFAYGNMVRASNGQLSRPTTLLAVTRGRISRYLHPGRIDQGH
jgi:CRISPR-associated protein Cas1